MEPATTSSSSAATACDDVKRAAEPWSISIKAVGVDILTTEETVNSSGERQFTVQVSPEDDLECLFDQIEASTGLKAAQQRLIYRGRLIGGGNNNHSTTPAAASTSASAPEKHGSGSTTDEYSSTSAASLKIKDIAGLGDGQTIHLVKRRETESSNQGNTSSEASSSTDGNNNNTTSRTRGGSSSLLDGDLLSGANAGTTTTTTTTGGGLLAALLGLSSLTDDGDGDSGRTTTGRQRWGLRTGSTSGGSRSITTSGSAATTTAAAAAIRNSRRPHYRLTAQDRQVPDPGSLEPVRQGLLTLHTLLPHLQTAENDTLPIECNREWYRGQWLDVLDTVNQWLEATVVEIVLPQDILPPSACTTTASSNDSRPRRRASPSLPCDAAVSASDLEGRRRLLLEPCEQDQDDPNDLGGELAGFRLRSNNQGVQLLLIHYNGWPHRWDEWIRSDSERLRPFRTRTRHPNVSSTASPTPQSIFHESPRTNILPHGDDTDDRMAILPEIARAVAAINDMLQQQVTAATGVAPTSMIPATPTPAVARAESPLVAPDLPWVTATLPPSDDTDNEDLVEPSPGEETSNILRPLANTESENDAPEDNDNDDILTREEALRCLTQGPETVIAMREAALARSTTTAAPPIPPPSLERPQYNRRELQNLATSFDRLGRILTDAALHVAALADNLPQDEEPMAMAVPEEDDLFDESVENALAEIAETMPAGSDDDDEDGRSESAIGGFLTYVRERRRSRANNTSTTNATANNQASNSASEPTIDPDHEDYVSGLVNTTRGEVRSGPRTRSSHDDVTNLLGAYLAAATLGSAASSLGEDGGTGGGLGGFGLGQLLRGGSIGGGGLGGGGGIDIHIHAVVTAPGMTTGGGGITAMGGGGGGGATAAGGTGLGGTRNLFSSTRRTSSTNSILRSSSRHSASSLLSSRRRVHTPDDDDESGLFAELYSETPEPIDPNGSPGPVERGSTRQASMPGLMNRDGDSSDYVTGLRTSYTGSSFRRERESPPDFLARINANTSSSLDPTNVGAASLAGRSSTRRRSSRRSLRRETADEMSNDSLTLPQRRSSSGWGRLFRRRSSRE